MTALVTFLDTSEVEQVCELQSYLESLNLKNAPKSQIDENNWAEGLCELLPALSECFTKVDLSSDDLSDTLLTFASMILLIPQDNPIQSKCISKFCEMFYANSTAPAERMSKAIFALDVIFKSLDESNHDRFPIFIALLECAHKINAINSITSDPDVIETWFNTCKCSPEEYRQLWRKLYSIHSGLEDTERSFIALIHLLKTYSEADAAKAKEDAIQCIVTAIKEPNVIVYDQLISLKPIQALKGEPMYDLLQLFIAGDLKSFKSFVEKNSKLLKDYKLSERDLLDKMRILNFMQLSEAASEIDYDELKSALNLPSDGELRDFIINVVRLKSVFCKLDELNRKIIIVSALPRSFGTVQWKNLHENLVQWREGIQNVHESLVNMIGPDAAQ